MFFEYNWHKLSLVKSSHIEMVVAGNTIGGQRGSVLIFVTLVLATLFGFAALAIDVGYLFVVRNELQNAADSAALAGANYLYPLNGANPNWVLANTKATSAIQLNKASNATLTDGQVSTGYWNITGSPIGVQATSITPGSKDMPTVKVTISKNNGNNGGGVATVFARVLGINSLDASATAVAVVASPGYTTKDLFPVAVTKCMYDNYWDSNTSQPTTNPPLIFQIGSSYHYSGCDVGQWTSFDFDTNNVPDVKNLIDYSTGAKTNPDPVKLSIQDDIWIQPGTKTTIYSSVDACSARGDRSCEYVPVPVVCFNSPTCSSLDTHTQTPIVGFACLHILQADGGSTKSITVQMVAMGTTVNGEEVCKVSGGGFGPNYGAKLPPKLANYLGNTY